MLFYLTNDLVANDCPQEEKIKIKRAVENVLRSVWESNHLVFAGLETIIELRKIITCDDCLRVLVHLQNNFSFLNYDSIKYYICVTIGSDIMVVNEGSDKSTLTLSIDYLQETKLTQPARIIGESLSDPAFFEIICKYYIEKNRIGNIALSYEEEHGSGNQIDTVYKKHLDSKEKFCLAFADNDKRYPTSEIGDTLQKLKDVDDGNHLCKYIALSCQEIENLVPFNYLDDIKNNTHQLDGISFIKNIVESDDKECLQFFDVKKGVKNSQIQASPDYHSFAEVLAPYCPVSIDFSVLDTFDGNYKIIPHVGKILPAFLKKTDLLNIKPPLFLAFQQLEWDKIGSQFLFWSCSRNSEPLNT